MELAASHQEKQCILLFVKYPEKGLVKRRLSEHLEEDFVVALYKSFVLDHLERVEEVGTPFFICFFPEERKEDFVSWLGRDYEYMPQTGNDLGWRMMNCFREAFSQGFDKVILTGSDSPDLPPAFPNEAFRSLGTHDTVLGPAFDGGFYLIGFRRDSFLPDVFKGISWGAETVFQETMARLEKGERTVHVLPVWHDVDRVDDLKELVKRNRNTKFRSSRTMNFLLENEEIIL